MKIKKFKIVLLILCIAYLIVLFILPIKIKIQTFDAPNEIFDISINKFSKKLYVKNTRFSSTVEHKETTTDNTTYLTSSEYWKIWYMYYFKPFSKSRRYLPEILEAISKDIAKFGNNNDLEYDLNNDGVVTWREFGNKWLSDCE